MLNRYGINRTLAVTVLATSLCGLLFGYDIGALSSSVPGLTLEFSLSSSMLGFAMAASLVGTILGSIFSGVATDILDRHHVLCIAGFAYVLGMLGAACAHSITSFIGFRLLCGIVIGVITVVAPMYLAEVSPSYLRGFLVGSFQFNISIGVALAFISGFILSRYAATDLAWRYMLAGGAVPAFFCGVLLIGSSPSPRWLVLKGRLSEAQRVIGELGFPDPKNDYENLILSLRHFGSSDEATLFSRRYARPIFLAVSIAVFNQLTGVNALLYYVLNVFQELGGGRLNGREDAILIACLGLVVTVAAISMIDRVGRKPLLLAGAAGMGLCLMLLPVIHRMHWPISIVVIVLLCYNAFFGFSQGSIIWVYLSEIFPLPVRARGQSLGSTVHWVTNALVVAAFPTATSILGGKIFYVFASLMALQFLTILFVYPETKCVSLETLASEMSH
ncbi:MAG TPA: sugar porter family MFS transporter [Edaphobacter sp.]|nr:sugar porter family MFS transporter [Edaphobacter sp.]